MRRLLASMIVTVVAGCNNQPSSTCESWQQWGNSASHDNTSCATGQKLETEQADLVYDPFIPDELADAQGDLLVHYQTPLLDGDDVYMMTKAGAYTPCSHKSGSTDPDCFQNSELYRLNTQVWRERRLHWSGNTLSEQWAFDSDWKPEPEVGFEPLFQPALDAGAIVVPAASGGLWFLDRDDGSVIRHVQPFGDAPDTYVAGALAVGSDGSIYYDAVVLDHADPYGQDAHGYLVAVEPGGTVRMVDFASLVPEAPAGTAECLQSYALSSYLLPWPPMKGSIVEPAPTYPCGTQVPGLNQAPAIGADGTLYVGSHAHFNERYSYAIAVDPDTLTAKWATSLRGLVADGCGVLVPDDAVVHTATEFDCTPGAPLGVDPQTGDLPALGIDDSSSSSPVALPDGGVLFGTFSGYNGSRGHLVKLDPLGLVRGTYDFGWDTTPTIIADGASYDIVLKDNHYGEDVNGVDLGPYYITELDANLHIKWQLPSTNTMSCTRGTDGQVSCTDDHPHGFEWCIDAAAVDRDGVIYANSEDGTVYAIRPDGTMRDSLFLDRAEGAAYTPVALDHAGRVYALNNGHLAVVGAK